MTYMVRKLLIRANFGTRVVGVGAFFAARILSMLRVMVVTQILESLRCNLHCKSDNYEYR